MGNYIPDYLVFRARESGTFTFKYGSGVPAVLHTSISYSLDGKNWTTAQNVDSEEVSLTTPTIPAGGKVYWKGTGYGMTQDRSTNKCCSFSSTKNFDASGNIMSLLYGNGDFSSKKTFERYSSSYNNTPVFFDLFKGSKLVSAEKLLLPATTLVSRCYQEMFYSCQSLTDAPALPATSLAWACYSAMFSGCKVLQRAPVLPAETLQSQCYYQMFYNCTALNYIKAMFLTNTASQALQYWVNGVNGTGTFVKNANATWETTYGASAVPTNFTVVIE